MPLSEIVKIPAHRKEVSEFLGVKEKPQAQPVRDSAFQNRNARHDMMVMCD
jgi:hypothetical protein